MRFVFCDDYDCETGQRLPFLGFIGKHGRRVLDGTRQSISGYASVQPLSRAVPSLIMVASSSGRIKFILDLKKVNFRLLLVCFAAASVGLPMAIISIAKLLLLLAGVVVLLMYQFVRVQATDWRDSKTTFAVLLVIFLFALSLIWTAADMQEALRGLGKYGKLLVIPVIIALLRTRHEALIALACFSLTQLFLMMSSSLQFAGIAVPWATSHTAATHFATFSSYLDQGIMTAVFASFCWQLRGLVPGKQGSKVAICFAAVALFNVFFVFQGRSGHAVAIVLISLALMWELPKRYKLAVVVLPFLLLLTLSAISPKVSQRLAAVQKEVNAYSIEKGEDVVGGTSSGIRLHLWHRALQSINQHPVKGAGVGSWNVEFNRFERLQNPQHQDIPALGNPHQEYLLWGVQLGIPGVLLFVALMACILRDSLGMAVHESRAVQSLVCALAVACLFNATLYDALIGDFFCIALGLLLALGAASKADLNGKPLAA